jgi:hypothetical protein
MPWLCNHSMFTCISSRIGINVEHMDEGIGTGKTINKVDSEPTEEQVIDSIFDENIEILEFEKRALDDVEGIESEIE